MQEGVNLKIIAPERSQNIARSFDPIITEVMNALLAMKTDIKKDSLALMIMIDGPAGVGKSTFSKDIYEQLKERLSGVLSVTFLPQNLFVVSRSARAQLGINSCSDAARDAILFEKMDQLIERKSIRVPHYNPATGERVKDAGTIEPADVIVTEDVSCLGFYYPALRHKQQVVFRIFIQPENDKLLHDSRIIRDEKERGITQNEFEANWQESVSHNWIFTYRGRTVANLTMTRKEQKSSKNDVVFTLMQSGAIKYKDKEYSLSGAVKRDFTLCAQWDQERAKKLTQSPQKEVYDRALLPIMSRAILGKEHAKQKMLTEIHKKQGLGNVVSLMSKAEKPIRRNGPIYSQKNLLPSRYTKLVLESGMKKNSFNPAPRFSFMESKSYHESVILNVLEPSTQPSNDNYGLSNFELVAMSDDALKKYLHAKTDCASISAVLSYQKQLKEFYNSRFYFTFKIGERQLGVTQPTSPYFKEQVLFFDMRGNVPSFIEEKSKHLALKTKPVKRRHSFSLAPKKTPGEQKKPPQMRNFVTRRHSIDLGERVFRQKSELAFDEAKHAQQKVMLEISEIKGYSSQTDVELMLNILKDLKPGDILGQNSPSAITDTAVVHMQCFNETQTGILPIFKAKRKEATEVLNGRCCELDFPTSSHMFSFNQITDETIRMLRAIQNEFLEKNSGLPDKDKSDIALIARKTSEGGIEVIFMLRKHLQYHEVLVHETAREILAKEESVTFYNRRPGFLEMAGCFLQDKLAAYDVLTDARIDKLLSEYSANQPAINLFNEVIKGVKNITLKPVL